MAVRLFNVWKNQPNYDLRRSAPTQEKGDEDDGELRFAEGSPNRYTHSIWGRNETQFKEAARSDFIAAWDNDRTPSCDWP